MIANMVLHGYGKQIVKALKQNSAAAIPLTIGL